MKKLLLILAAVALSFSATWAQGPISIGGHAAVSFGSLYGDGATGMPWGLGLNIGAAGKMALGPGALSPEIDFELRRQSDDDISATEYVINIPVLYKYDVMPNIFVEGGISLGFLLGMSLEDEDVNNLNTFEFGLVFGAGATVMPNLDVDFRLGFGLTSIYDDVDIGFAKVEVDASNIQLSIGATYWFM